MNPEDRNPDAAISRRWFVGSLAGAAAAAGALPLLGNDEPAADATKKRSAVDRVKLGKTSVRPTRLGMGTGSNGGKVQRDLGQEGFTKLIRHGWERGIRFIDTADMYKIHEMVREAIKGLPREELVIQTKIMWEQGPDVHETLERFRKELGMDYFDHVLIHCATKKAWPETLKRMRDQLSEAKQKGIVKAHGVSCHGLPGLREVPGCEWVDVNLARVNHRGHHMDGAKGDWSEPSIQEEAIATLKKSHAAGKGIIGMKLVGNGDFQTAEDREKATQFVMKCGFVDCVVMGFKSPAEIDEGIDRINRALNS